MHAGPESADAARALHAQAYTVGSDIHFAAGRYRPDTAEGQQLIAHELAHVAQQARGGGSIAGAEARADRAARDVMRGDPVSPEAVGGAPHAVQAKPDAHGSDAPGGLTFPVTTLDAFALSSAALTSRHLDEIKRLAWSIGLHAGMLRDPSVTIAIVGHTDRSGIEKINDPLGQTRADTVRQALIDALAKEGVKRSTLGDIPSSSMGESRPVVPTPDGVKNARNRRVEIAVHVGPKAAPAPPPPEFDPFTLPPGSIAPEPAPGPRRETDKWQEMEENQRRIEEYDRKHPRTQKGLSELIIDKVMDDLVDPIIRKLPLSKDLRRTARSAIRKGLERGTEAACDAAVDATGVTGEKAEALKAACRAALKEKGAWRRTP